MAVLRVRKGHAAGTVHAVFSTRQHTVIGRDEGVEVGLGDARASRRHAAISLAHGYWVLQDLKSRNSTLVDGKPIERIVLRDGTAFQVGASLLTFHESELAPPPTLEVGGSTLIECLREESGVFTFRGRQSALDREVRVDWVHPSRPLSPELARALPAAIEAAGRLRSPGFLPLVLSSAGSHDEMPHILFKDAPASTLAERIEEVLSRPLEERIRAFRELVDLLLERSTWESLRCPIGLAHVPAVLREGAIEVQLPPIDLAALATADLGGGPHVRAHADSLPPERQGDGAARAEGEAPPLSGAMYALGAMGYHLLTGKRAMGDGDVRSVLENHRSVRPAPANLLEPGIPATVSAVIERMLEKDPRKRPLGRQEVLAEIPVIPAAGGTVTLAFSPAPALSSPAGAQAQTPPPAAEPRTARRLEPAPRREKRPTPSTRPAVSGADGSGRAAVLAGEPRGSAHGLLYLPLWMLLWIALFFAAKYLTKVVLGQLDG
jgi:hypothetical protein